MRDQENNRIKSVFEIKIMPKKLSNYNNIMLKLM